MMRRALLSTLRRAAAAPAAAAPRAAQAAAARAPAALLPRAAGVPRAPGALLPRAAAAAAAPRSFSGSARAAAPSVADVLKAELQHELEHYETPEARGGARWTQRRRQRAARRAQVLTRARRPRGVHAPCTRRRSTATLARDAQLVKQGPPEPFDLHEEAGGSTLVRALMPPALAAAGV
jgi:hypothetical protein